MRARRSRRCSPACFLLLILLLVSRRSPRYLPVAAMAALLFIVAWGLIDVAAMRRIVAHAAAARRWMLVVTFVATLTIQLEFAILVGVLVSLLVYLQRTTHPA